jgi:hypothetical protein
MLKPKQQPCAGCQKPSTIWKRIAGLGYCSRCAFLIRNGGPFQFQDPEPEAAPSRSPWASTRSKPLKTTSLPSATLRPSPSPPKPRTRTALKPMSAKQRGLTAQYSQLRKEFLLLPGNSCCHAQLPLAPGGCKGCDSSYLEVHHKRGRGKYLLDTSTWVPLCHFCHAYLETHPEEAKLLGFSASRL